MSRHERHPTKTNATRLLETAGVSFRTFEYEVDEEDLSGADIAEHMKVDPACVFKTLVLKGEKNGYLVCCLPVCDELDLKKVAKAFGDKKCDLIPMKTLRDLTGYVRGGCSPIGMKKQFPPLIDETALLFDEIYVNAGMRGLMMIVEPRALAEYAGATLVDLVQD